MARAPKGVSMKEYQARQDQNAGQPVNTSLPTQNSEGELNNMENNENMNAQPVDQQDQTIVHNNVEKSATPATVKEKAPVVKKTIEPHACACGCGTVILTKGQFVSGHDAQLKSKLVNAAVAGSEHATAELERLGWLEHLDKKLAILAREKVPAAERFPSGKAKKAKVTNWREGLVVITDGRYAMVTDVHDIQVGLSDGTFANKEDCRVIGFDTVAMAGTNLMAEDQEADAPDQDSDESEDSEQ